MERDYQLDLDKALDHAFEEPNVFNVMFTLATGGGKTHVFCKYIIKKDVPTAIIAHRAELIAQAALTVNREGVFHGIIAPKALIQTIIQAQYRLHGYSNYRANAKVRIVSIDTVIRRDTRDPWYNSVQQVVIDEGHHVQAENKWGRGMRMFPNARGLFPTAHAVRADGCGLGRGHGGLVDRLVIGPYGRQLIDRGFLADYRLICADSDVDYSNVDVGPSGEYNHAKLCAATHKSNKLVGDVVDHYLHHTPGQLGITFAVDVLGAKEIADKYNSRDVRAAVISGDTDLLVRVRFMEQFREKKLLQLVSVDCLGEGVDVPAVQVISMARRTASWQNYGQQTGRGGRVMVDARYANDWAAYTDQQRLAVIAASEKPYFTLIDHVGNVGYHYESRGTLFDGRQVYSLSKHDRSNRSKADVIPLRHCVNADCRYPYERYRDCCPRCGTLTPPPAGKGSPEEVEGKLELLPLEVLQRMRKSAEDIFGPCRMPPGISADAQRAVLRRHHARFTAQQTLRTAMRRWCGWRTYTCGESDAEAQSRFFYTFGLDALTAQSLEASDSNDLQERIQTRLNSTGLTFA